MCACLRARACPPTSLGPAASRLVPLLAFQPRQAASPSRLASQAKPAPSHASRRPSHGPVTDRHVPVICRRLVARHLWRGARCHPSPTPPLHPPCVTPTTTQSHCVLITFAISRCQEKVQKSNLAAYNCDPVLSSDDELHFFHHIPKKKFISFLPSWNKMINSQFLTCYSCDITFMISHPLIYLLYVFLTQ